MTNTRLEIDEAIITARMGVSLLRAGRALSDDEQALLWTRTKRLVAAAEALRSIPLANHDEPEHIFGPGRPATVPGQGPAS